MIFDLVYFINIVLSLLVAIYLWYKLEPKHETRHTKVLAAYFFLNAFCFSFYLIIKHDIIVYIPYLYKLPAPITYLIAPAAYLHVRIIITKSTTLQPLDSLHLLPFFIFLISYLPFYLQDLTTKNLYVERLVSDFSLSYRDNIGLIPENINTLGRILHPLFYLILQWRILKSVKATSLKTKEKGLYLWVYNFVLIQSLFFGSLVITSLTSIYFLPDLGSVLIGVLSAILTIFFFFTMSIYLFWNQNILNKLKYFTTTTTHNTKESASYNLDTISKIVYDKELFKDVENGLIDLSKHLNISKIELSRLINRKYSSYNVWINEIKINHSISLIENSFLDNYSIEALAKECGFKSKTTFYRAFKSKTGKTPLSYLNSCLKKMCKS